jgi:hypothetical protein
MQCLYLQFCNPLPIFWGRVREGVPQNENENVNEYVNEITRFPYSFSDSYSFCGFGGLYLLSKIVSSFRL